MGYLPVSMRLIVILLLALMTPLFSGCQTRVDEGVIFQAMVGRRGDTVEILRWKNAASFLITSPTGIGSATITLWQGRWPSDVRVRLRYAEGRPYTKLESFTCAIGDEPPVEIHSISYHPEFAEMQLPPKVLRPSTHILKLQWVDQYRQ